MKFGFIGTGNMGSAIIGGYVQSGQGEPQDIFAYDYEVEKAEKLRDRWKINVVGSIEALVDSSDTVVLAVKPDTYDSILHQLKPLLKDRQTILSMAAGISMGYIEGKLGKNTKVVRIMPNTPALINCGMTAVFKNTNVGSEEFEAIMGMLKSIGKVEQMDEELIHAVIGVSGSSPAYVYMFIEALVQGAVENGMNRETAKVCATQAVLGAANMVLNTGEEPSILRDRVCSPGGTTIRAVESLNQNGFGRIIKEGMEAAIQQSKNMTK